LIKEIIYVTLQEHESGELTLQDEKIEAKFLIGGGVVHPWHIDQFGHMNVRWYSHFFDDAAFQFLNKLGLDQTAMIEDFGIHSVTAQASTTFQVELQSGTCIEIFGRIKRMGSKSVTFEYLMTGSSTNVDHAICEAVEVFVDAKTHQSIEIPDAIRKRLEPFQGDASGGSASSAHTFGITETDK